jgi:hypothetical protein
MKTITFSSLLLFFSIISFGQNKVIIFNVVDAQSKPIEKARIFQNGISIIRTDKNGQALFSKPITQKDIFQVKLEGFVTESNIHVNAGPPDTVRIKVRLLPL